MRQELSKWEKDQDKEHGRAEIGERHEVRPGFRCRAGRWRRVVLTLRALVP